MTTRPWRRAGADAPRRAPPGPAREPRPRVRPRSPRAGGGGRSGLSSTATAPAPRPLRRRRRFDDRQDHRPAVAGAAGAAGAAARRARRARRRGARGSDDRYARDERFDRDEYDDYSDDDDAPAAGSLRQKAGGRGMRFSGVLAAVAASRRARRRRDARRRLRRRDALMISPTSRGAAPVARPERGVSSATTDTSKNDTARPATRATRASHHPGVVRLGRVPDRRAASSQGGEKVREIQEPPARIRAARGPGVVEVEGGRAPPSGRFAWWRWPLERRDWGTAPPSATRRPAGPTVRTTGRFDDGYRDDRDDGDDETLYHEEGTTDPGGLEDELEDAAAWAGGGAGAARAVPARGDVQVRGRRLRPWWHASRTTTTTSSRARVQAAAPRRASRRWWRWARAAQPHPGADVRRRRGGLHDETREGRPMTPRA